MHLPQLTPINKILIIIVVAVFVIQSIISATTGVFLAQIFGLSASMFGSGHIYELLTYPFVGRGPLEVVFNGILLWFIGSEFEQMWGKKRYLSFLATVTLGAGVIFLICSALFFSGGRGLYVLSGMGGFVNALLVTYAIIYPERIFTFMLLFPMKAKYFCMILIGMQLYSGIFSPGGVLAWGHLGAMLVGFLYLVLISSTWYKTRDERKQKEQIKRRIKKSNLTIVKDDKTPPKYWQ